MTHVITSIFLRAFKIHAKFREKKHINFAEKYGPLKRFLLGWLMANWWVNVRGRTESQKDSWRNLQILIIKHISK